MDRFRSRAYWILPCRSERWGCDIGGIGLIVVRGNLSFTSATEHAKAIFLVGVKKAR